MPIIDNEVNLILIQSWTCVISNSAGVGKFEKTNTKLYVPVVISWSQHNAKLLQQLKFGFKITINGININQTQKSMHKTKT